MKQQHVHNVLLYIVQVCCVSTMCRHSTHAHCTCTLRIRIAYGLNNYTKKSFMIQAITSKDCFFNNFVVCFNVLKFEGGSTMNNHEMMALDEKHNAEFEELVKYCMTSGAINLDLYEEYDVKRGLRDANGKGVLTGLTEISDVVSYKSIDGVKTPIDGELYYQGYNVADLIEGLMAGGMLLRRPHICFYSVSFLQQSSLRGS